MKFKSSYLFMALVFTLAGYTYLFEYRKSVQQEEKVEADKQIFSLVKEDFNKVDKIELENATGKFVLKKENQQWRIVEPVNDSADPNVITDWLEALYGEKALEFITSEEAIPWPSYGLDKPKAKLTLYSNNLSQTVEVSDKKNFEGSAFIRKDGQNQVTLATGNWLGLTDKGLSELRDKRILRRVTTGVQSFLYQGKETFELKVDQGVWGLVDSPKTLLSQNLVRELIVTLSEARAIDYVTEAVPTPAELKKYGLNKPAISTTLTFPESVVWTANFGQDAEKNWYVVSTESIKILKLPSAQIEKIINATRLNLRERSTMFLLQPTNISKIKILGKEEVVLSKGKDLWTWNKAEALDQNQVQLLMTSIANLRVADFKDEMQQWPTDIKSDRSIEFFGLDGESVLKLEFAGQYNSKEVGLDRKLKYAKSSLYKDIFGVDETSFLSLPLDRLYKVVSQPEEK